MPNESLNNDFHWKSKLEELESLPGETFNKEVVWGKLHSRLQKKSGGKKLVLYWIAAACLLLAILTPLFLSNKEEDVLVRNNPVQQIQSSTSHLLPENNKDSIEVISSTPVEKKSPVSKVENGNKIITSIDHKILTVENISVKKVKKEFIEPEISDSAWAPVDNQVSIAAIAPEKKKLRVVHINELGDPVEESSAMARKTEVHSFQLKLARQEVFVNPSVHPGSTAFTILVLKNSPN